MIIPMSAIVKWWRKATEQTETKLRDLESRLEEFGIKLRSAQEGSGAF